MTTLDELQKEYCPPLDAATFIAIASDFNLSNENELSQAQATLNALKVYAVEEEQSGFDPSGSSGSGQERYMDIENCNSERAESCPDFATTSQDTDTTTGFSSLDLQSVEDSANGSPQAYGDVPDLEELDMDEKDARLRLMFPSLSKYTITHSLKKFNGAFYRTIDDLLTQAHFQEQDSKSENSSKLAPKGIDGFAEQNTTRGRKGKNRKAKLVGGERRSSSTSASWDYEEPENKWNIVVQDVEFIISRTHLSRKQVTSVYHEKGASLAATLHSLVATETAKPSRNIDEATIWAQVSEFSQSFPHFPSTTVAAILRLTMQQPLAAHELAEVMMQRPNYVDQTDPIQILSQQSPIDFRSEDEYEAPAVGRGTNLSAANTHLLSLSHRESGTAAFSQASLAYRKGKSQPLMGAAASYYSEIGRQHIENSKKLAAAAAEARVQEQSSPTSLDLHGVGVHDAVRITKLRVRQWWDALGDAKYAPGGGGPARSGFNIVTGRGTHSRPGAPRIGPALLKQLTAEGWKVEVGEGQLTVLGRARAK